MPNKDYQLHHPDALASLPLERLNHEVSRCVYGYQTGGSSQGRKAFFKRLVMLEKLREEVHGIPAERRRFSER